MPDTATTQIPITNETVTKIFYMLDEGRYQDVYLALRNHRKEVVVGTDDYIILTYWMMLAAAMDWQTRTARQLADELKPHTERMIKGWHEQISISRRMFPGVRLATAYYRGVRNSL